MPSDIVLDEKTLQIQAPSRLNLDAPVMYVNARTLEVRSSNTGKPAIRLSPIAAQLQLHAPASNHESGVVLYDDGAPVVRVMSQGVTASELEKTRVFVDGENGNVTLGGHGTDGDLLLRDHQGDIIGHISASVTRDANAHQVVHPSAKLRVNCALGQYKFGGANGGVLEVQDRSNRATIVMRGSNGKLQARDIALTGTDSVSSVKGELHELRAMIGRLEARLRALE